MIPGESPAQSLNVDLKLHFLGLEDSQNAALVRCSDFHPGALHEDLRQLIGCRDVCAFCHDHPLAQQLKQTVSPSEEEEEEEEEEISQTVCYSVTSDMTVSYLVSLDFNKFC